MTPTPFTGRRLELPIPMRTMARFRKPGHEAELRERRVTRFNALEWMLFVDGNLIESRLYHGPRLSIYAAEFGGCCDDLRKHGWVEDSAADAPALGELAG
jgi:hypothetical protein